MGRKWAVGIATRYGLDGPEIESRWGTSLSAPVQAGPEAHPASYTMGSGIFSGSKGAGAWCSPPTPSTAEVKERVQPYLYSRSGPSWLVPELTWPFLFLKTNISLPSVHAAFCDSPSALYARSRLCASPINPYPTAFPYGNGMVLHFYQQQESSTTKTVHKVINKGLKAYV